MSGRSAKQKGTRVEREFAKAIDGKRVPLSGSLGGDLIGDVHGLNLIWEVKARKKSWGQLYSWLDNVDALAIKADRRNFLVVMPLDKFMMGWGKE